MLMVRIFGLLLIFSSSFVNGQEIQLTFSPNDHFNPRFSPGGQWILYQRATSSGDSLIYKIFSAGGTEILLSSQNASDFNPNWSPDGEWICCEKRDSAGFKQIYVAQADGSQAQAITN